MFTPTRLHYHHLTRLACAVIEWSYFDVKFLIVVLVLLETLRVLLPV